MYSKIGYQGGEIGGKAYANTEEVVTRHGASVETIIAEEKGTDGPGDNKLSELDFIVVENFLTQAKKWSQAARQKGVDNGDLKSVENIDGIIEVIDIFAVEVFALLRYVAVAMPDPLEQMRKIFAGIFGDPSEVRVTSATI